MKTTNYNIHNEIESLNGKHHSATENMNEKTTAMIQNLAAEIPKTKKHEEKLT